MKLSTKLRRKAFPLILMYSIASILCCLMVPMATGSSSTVTFRVEDVTKDAWGYPGLVVADIYIDASEDSAIVGWTVDIKVNPDVLELGYDFGEGVGVYYGSSGFSGYFLYDWCDGSPDPNWPPGTEFNEGAANVTAGELIGTIEGIVLWGDLGQGTGANGTGMLVTLFFTYKSASAYSPILIKEAWYYTSWNAPEIDKDVPDILHGHYNLKQDFPVTVDGLNFNVVIESNSTVSDFEFRKDQKEISFNVTGLEGTVGFCNVTIPMGLMQAIDEPWLILIDGVETTYIKSDNGTHTFLYFTYTHTTRNIIIRGTWVVPEFPTLIPLLLALAILAVSTIILMRRTHKHPLTRRLRRW